MPKGNSLAHNLLTLVRGRLTALTAAILVPATGLWFTYWERAHAERETRQKQDESEVAQHRAFIEDISNRIINKQFRYLDQHNQSDRAVFLQLIADEAKVLGTDSPLSQGEQSAAMAAASKPLPQRDLSELYGAKLMLLLESSRDGHQSENGPNRSARLAKQTLHFLRRNGLLASGGLLDDADLSDLNLKGVNLSCTSIYAGQIDNVNFSDSNLAMATLRPNYQITDSNFSNSLLFGAWFGRNWISKTSFRGANLQHASLRKASVQQSDFEEADLRRAILFGARVADDNNFNNADLRGANLLIDVQASGSGRLFNGAFANSKPRKSSDSKVIPATLIPKGFTFEKLGLIDVAASDDPGLPNASTRKGEEGREYHFPSDCQWRLDSIMRLEILYRRSRHGGHVQP